VTTKKNKLIKIQSITILICIKRT